MKKKRIPSAILAVLMLLPLAAACAPPPSTPQETLAESESDTGKEEATTDQNDKEGTEMKEPIFDISVNKTSGGLDSIVIKGDPHKMNWCGNTRHFGEISAEFGEGKTFKSAMQLIARSNSVSAYENGTVRVTVRRSFDTDGCLRETYTVKNLTSDTVSFRKGDLGIYVPLADEYKTADISLTNYCNQHVWFGENIAWVNALRQGPSEQNVGLVLLEGSIDSYSMDRENQTIKGNRRANLILNLELSSLRSGEEYTISWKLFTHKGTEDFFNKLTGYGRNIDFSTENYTVIGNEHFVFDFAAESATVTCDGAAVPFIKKNGRIYVDYAPRRTGEHRFDIVADGLRTHVALFSSPDLDTLIEARVHYIVENQQCHDPSSELDGAYLIYDTKEHSIYYNKDFYDHNACRERIGMALLIARYLQTHDDPAVHESLKQYVRFAFREFISEETGEVFNSVGYDNSYFRLYNAPWAMMLMAELYKLEGDVHYLDVLVKIVRKFYEQGGVKFYPNAVDIELLWSVLEEAKHPERAEVWSLFETHVEHMLKIGLNYPRHEAIYEQTIVTPAVTFITQWGLLTGDKSYIERVQDHLECLLRFDGMQPDYRLNEIPTRYWDDHWFGKSGIYADTLHYWSCLTADSFDSYYRLSGDETYRARAINCIRNCLCLFRADGAASCAYVIPYRVDSYAGEFYDDWANDQDFALYYAMQLLK